MVVVVEKVASYIADVLCSSFQQTNRLLDLVYFQQNACFVVTVAVAVVFGAVKFLGGLQISDVEFAELVVLVGKCMVAVV